jgi:hemoglobin
MKSPQGLYYRIGEQEGLKRLLRHFYADVRQHALIGPVFNKQISDWPRHLETIGSFWAQLTGGPAGYAGRMPARHLNLGLEERHFQVWLQLWESHCAACLGRKEAREMITLAHDIGRRLKRIIGVELFPVLRFPKEKTANG